MAINRYVSLDAMRGITLALMIIVNTPGSWSHVFAPLLHADWHGWTFTDLVFPFFLFIVGAALFFSRSASQSLSRSEQCRKILRRTCLLIGIGVFLEAYPFLHSIDTLRLPGVLQRIGLAFGLAALLQVFMPARWNLGVIVLILLGYGFILLCATDPYGLEGNLVRTVDLMIFGEAHLWHGKGVAFDPEGLLSTVSATATVLIGFEAARWLKAGKAFSHLLGGLFVVGCAMASLAYLLPIPINKSLWTSSYVLLTGGLALLTMGGLLCLEQLPSGRKLLAPFCILGQNPLLIYVLSWLWVRSYSLIPTADGTLYETLFVKLALSLPVNLASLTFALLHLAPLWLLAFWLHARKIYIKI